MLAIEGKFLCAGIGTVSPIRPLRHALEVVEWFGARPSRLADDNAAHHAGVLMGDAEVVVHPLYRECHRKALFRGEIVGIPRLGAIGMRKERSLFLG
jgi:hypothetical protein